MFSPSPSPGEEGVQLAAKAKISLENNSQSTH